MGGLGVTDLFQSREQREKEFRVPMGVAHAKVLVEQRPLIGAQQLRIAGFHSWKQARQCDHGHRFDSIVGHTVISASDPRPARHPRWPTWQPSRLLRP